MNEAKFLCLLCDKWFGEKFTTAHEDRHIICPECTPAAIQRLEHELLTSDEPNSVFANDIRTACNEVMRLLYVEAELTVERDKEKSARERLSAEDGRLRRFNDQNIRQVFIDAYTRACQRMRKHGECTGLDLETDYEAMCKATPGIFLDTASTQQTPPASPNPPSPSGAPPGQPDEWGDGQ